MKPDDGAFCRLVEMMWSHCFGKKSRVCGFQQRRSSLGDSFRKVAPAAVPVPRIALFLLINLLLTRGK